MAGAPPAGARRDRHNQKFLAWDVKCCNGHTIGITVIKQPRARDRLSASEPHLQFRNPKSFRTATPDGVRSKIKRTVVSLDVCGNACPFAGQVRFSARAPGDDNGCHKEQGGCYALPYRQEEVAEDEACGSDCIDPSRPARPAAGCGDGAPGKYSSHDEQQEKYKSREKERGCIHVVVKIECIVLSG